MGKISSFFRLFPVISTLVRRLFYILKSTILEMYMYDCAKGMCINFESERGPREGDSNCHFYVAKSALGRNCIKIFSITSFSFLAEGIHF